MLKNDYLVAKIGVDTAENEPRPHALGADLAAVDRVSLRAAKGEARVQLLLPILVRRPRPLYSRSTDGSWVNGYPWFYRTPPPV